MPGRYPIHENLTIVPLVALSFKDPHASKPTAALGFLRFYHHAFLDKREENILWLVNPNFHSRPQLEPSNFTAHRIEQVFAYLMNAPRRPECRLEPARPSGEGFIGLKWANRPQQDAGRTAPLEKPSGYSDR